MAIHSSRKCIPNELAMPFPFGLNKKPISILKYSKWKQIRNKCDEKAEIKTNLLIKSRYVENVYAHYLFKVDSNETEIIMMTTNVEKKCSNKNYFMHNFPALCSGCECC